MQKKSQQKAGSDLLNIDVYNILFLWCNKIIFNYTLRHINLDQPPFLVLRSRIAEGIFNKE